MTCRVLEVIASSRGGGAAHVRDLALALSRDPFHLEVVMPRDGGQVTAEDLTLRGVRCHTLPLAGGFSPAAWARLRRLGRGFALLHAHGARAALYARLVAASLGSSRPRVVYTLHGFAAPHYPQPRRSLLLAAEHALARRTDAVVAVCEAERDAYLARVAIPKDRVHVIANGVAAESFEKPDKDPDTTRWELGIPQGALVVLTSCRLDRPRDFTTLLPAFAGLAADHAQARLLIAGDGPLRASIESACRALEIENRVTLLGWRRDLPALMAASDVFALTSWGWEGMPLAVLEAMAAGLPVVGTQSGGLRDLVEPDRTGYLVPPRRVEPLETALRRLADPDRRRELGAAGRERAARFPLAVTVARIAHLYGVLCPDHGEPR